MQRCKRTNRDALRDWKLRRSGRDFDTEELRRLWNEGIASGPGHFRSIDHIKKEARRREAKAARPRARDAAVENWLRKEVARSYDEYKANPNIAIPVGKIMSRLRASRKKRKAR
jgi:hypothetical protein